MSEEIRVAKRCPRCNHRLFDKMSLASGFVEIKCPECGNIVRINLALRRKRPNDAWPYYGGMGRYYGYDR